MKWIDATALQQWGERLDARVRFPELIGDLIRASVTDYTAFRFPQGEKGQVRGFDGYLEVKPGHGTPFVPEGTSIWELGTGRDTSKHEADYKTKTKNTGEDLRRKATLVLVLSRTIDVPTGPTSREAWVEEKRSLGEWADVRLYDGSVVESWIDLCPAVGSYFATQVMDLLPQEGVRSIDEFWADYRGRFDPPLHEDVLLCGRRDEGKSLLAALAGSPAPVRYMADSPEEVTAFAVAAIRRASPEQQAVLAPRTLVVESDRAVLELANARGHVFLLGGSALAKPGTLPSMGATLIGRGMKRGPENAVPLPRPVTHDMATALGKMGFDEERAILEARKCGRSVTVLKRTRAMGEPSPPPWEEDAAQLLPAILAGAWDTMHEGDGDVLAVLTDGQDYDRFEDLVAPHLRAEDPFVDQFGSVWAVRAPIDAFTVAGVHIGREQRERLRTAVRKVFGTEQVAPKSEDSFSAPRATYSEFLRTGLASSLLYLACLSEAAEMRIDATKARTFVDELISDLPALRGHPGFLEALGNETPLLAEASPDRFIQALERMFEGDRESLVSFFKETPGLFLPTVHYLPTLFALEVLAWSPRHLPRVAKLLLRMNAFDEGGQVGNRPFDTLVRIFLPWSPCTFSLPEERTAVLRDLLEADEDAAWKLLVKLMPDVTRISSSTTRPRLRDLSEGRTSGTTTKAMYQAQDAAIDLALGRMNDRVERWIALTDVFTSFPPDRREAFLQAGNSYLERANRTDRARFWSALNEEFKKHESFPDVDWTLKGDELDAVRELLAKHSPKDAVRRHRWLFDSWRPVLPYVEGSRRDEVEDARAEAVVEIIREKGVSGVLELAIACELPNLVGGPAVAAARKLDGDPITLLIELLGEGMEREAPLPFLQVLAASAAFELEDAWLQAFPAVAKERQWEGERTVELLQRFPDRPSIWSMVDTLGSKVASGYWSRKHVYPVGDDDVREAAQRYERVGRFAAALDVIGENALQVGPEHVLDLLDKALGELAASDQSPTSPLFSFHLRKLFDRLREALGASSDALVRAEIAWFDLLRNEDGELALYERLATDPAFFVMMLGTIYRAEDAQEIEPTHEAANAATRAFRILMEFKHVPGFASAAVGSHVDGDALQSWIDEVLRLATECGLNGPAQTAIGTVLAHAPEDDEDEAWPHRTVRNVLEVQLNERVERALVIERFNMRGVHGKVLFEGGTQERELRDRYSQWASKCSRWPRTASVLRSIADDWERDAEAEDLRAEQDRLRH